MAEKYFTKISSSVVLILVLLAGCSVPAGNSTSQQFVTNSPAGIHQPARLSVFLHLRQPSAPKVSITISSVEVLSEETWLPLNRAKGGEVFDANGEKRADLTNFADDTTHWMSPGATPYS